MHALEPLTAVPTGGTMTDGIHVVRAGCGAIRPLASRNR